VARRRWPQEHGSAAGRRRCDNRAAWAVRIAAVWVGSSSASTRGPGHRWTHQRLAADGHRRAPGPPRRRLLL